MLSECPHILYYFGFFLLGNPVSLLSHYNGISRDKTVEQLGTLHRVNVTILDIFLYILQMDAAVSKGLASAIPLIIAKIKTEFEQLGVSLTGQPGFHINKLIQFLGKLIKIYRCH